jgi:Ca2+-transporting ATPase
MGLQQEGKAAAAVAALQKMVIITARVRRDGQLAEIPAGQLVPGDIVAIQAGDIVPADGWLLTAATLEAGESALMGESLPVAKGTGPVAGAGTPLGDRTDMVYMNTSVTRGAGEFVITATGMATEVGHISGMLAEEQAVKTPLTRQMDRLTGQILVIAGIALGASMALNLARGETFLAVFNAAVAFAIAGIPVGLPTVVTIRKALLRRRAPRKPSSPLVPPGLGPLPPERQSGAPRSGPSVGGDQTLAGIQTPAWACTRPEAAASASAAWSRSVWSA